LYFYPHLSAFKILLVTDFAYQRYNIYMNKRFESPDFCSTLDDLLPKLKRPRSTDPLRSAKDEKAKPKKQSQQESKTVEKRISE